MRARWILVGTLAGAGAYFLLRKPARRLGQQVSERIDELQQERASQDLEEMIEDVAHKRDMPDTPVRQAFDQAVHEHHRI